MEELTLRRFIFNEVMSVKLVEKSDATDTKWSIIVSTLDDEELDNNLVSEFTTTSKGTAFSTFEQKVNLLTGLVS